MYIIIIMQMACLKAHTSGPGEDSIAYGGIIIVINYDAKLNSAWRCSPLIRYVAQQVS